MTRERLAARERCSHVRIYRGLPGVADMPVALTIGNFDGVHRGHQAMLARLIEAAEDLRLLPAVLTFDPHAREFFAPSTAPARLSSLRSKLETFRAFGVARAYVARFDARLAGVSAEDFATDVLGRRLRARWVLVGDDFRFGKGRRGDLALLRAHARSYSVEAMATVDVAGERVSSSAVREALERGELAHACALLGRPYTLSGRVAHGRKLGRSLGFPTANIPLRRRPPISGVYAVRVHGLGASPRAAVASIGVRPTVTSEGRPLLEVYIFEFDEAIYGARVVVEFLHKLRDEARYPDLPALARQIRADVDDARDYFARATAP